MNEFYFDAIFLKIKKNEKKILKDLNKRRMTITDFSICLRLQYSLAKQCYISLTSPCSWPYWKLRLFTTGFWRNVYEQQY